MDKVGIKSVQAKNQIPIIKHISRKGASLMRKLYFFLFILPLIFAFSFQQIDRGLQVHPKIQQNLKGKQYALVVGINDYNYVSQLNYAINDARAMANLLRDMYGFEEVIQLTSPSETTRGKILEAMDKLAAKLTEQDRFLFYFSGHGKDLEGFGGKKTGYLIPIDGHPNKLGATCISMQTIREYATTIFKSKHVLFLIDSCFSGLIGESGRYANMTTLPKASIDELIQLTSDPRGQIITAGKSTEIAREDDTLGHGFFSYYVLEALKSPGDIDYNGLITVDELYHYVKRKVLTRSNNRQTPQLRFLDRCGEGEFVFVLGKEAEVAEVLSDITKPEITFEPKYGSLEINIDIAGAKVYLDGSYQGTTNEGYAFVINKLLTGSHSIRISKDQFKDYETTIKVNEVERGRLAVELEPLEPLCGKIKWILKDNLTGKILNSGTTNIYKKDIYIERRRAKDGQVFYSKSIALNSNFIIGISIYPEKDKYKKTGFGMWLDRKDMDTFSWEWFDIKSKEIAVKRQYYGLIEYGVDLINSKWEFTRTKFLSDTVFRCKISGKQHKTRWTVTIYKDSYINWSP